MHIIKLDATDSTNLYLKDLMNSEFLEDYTIVVADEQTLGRGQIGTRWESEPCKNLTFSMLKKVDALQITNPFDMNICVSLAVYNTLSALRIPDLKVKWPNDILSGNYKICGILIENILSGRRMLHSVIGIGVNVNQTTFKNLPNVSSLKSLLGKNIDLDALLKSFQNELKDMFLLLEDKGVTQIRKEYEKVLFRKDKPSTFKDVDDIMFMGFIQGVSNDGKLMVILEDNIKKEFDMKEISLLY